MAFLDNSGDIILDAVLTDTGRMRLARGDGSFKIVKFALGDDEIDYESFDGNHPSGSAFYDLEILQTPIFEAFTNNTATMKTKLLSLTNNNLLYLPMLKLNQKGDAFKPPTASDTFLHSGSHVLVVDEPTRNEMLADAGFANTSQLPVGFLDGESPGAITANQIRVDQGLDTNEISPSLTLDPELKETQYILEMDSRFCKLYDQQGDGAVASPSFIDDDLIATYYVTRGSGGYIADQVPGPQTGAESTAETKISEIRGPRGTKIRFGLLAAVDLVSSNYLFDVLGTTITDAGGNSYAFIDTTIRVVGVTTGFRLDIPLRIVKLQTAA
tara:strand:+ start:3806 stop:4786 length:981 start_codon:yes stop_codon:yes gene_type:complete